MVSAVPIGRLVRESAPAAIVLFVWAAFAAILPASIAGSARLAGVLMATLYVVVRGVSLAGVVETSSASSDPVDVLRENVGVALAAGAWFVAAALVGAMVPIAEQLHLYRVARGFLQPAVFALGGTGVATVVLFVVVAGLPRVRRATGGTERDGHRSADVAPGDD